MRVGIDIYLEIKKDCYGTPSVYMEHDRVSNIVIRISSGEELLEQVHSCYNDGMLYDISELVDATDQSDKNYFRNSARIAEEQFDKMLSINISNATGTPKTRT